MVSVASPHFGKKKIKNFEEQTRPPRSYPRSFIFSTHSREQKLNWAIVRGGGVRRFLGPRLGYLAVHIPAMEALIGAREGALACWIISRQGPLRADDNP